MTAAKEVPTRNSSKVFRLPGWAALVGIVTLLVCGWLLAMEPLAPAPPVLAGCVAVAVAAVVFYALARNATSAAKPAGSLFAPLAVFRSSGRAWARTTCTRLRSRVSAPLRDRARRRAATATQAESVPWPR